MNKIFSMLLLFAAASTFVGCAGEEDDIFDKSAAERLNETAAIYTERLEASTGGWTMEYYPTTDTVAPYGMGYLMLVKFNNNSSVNIAMNNAYSNNAYLEDMSSYEVISDNGPVLTFNTYNQCLHTFSTPEDIASTSKDEQGTGFEGDYEFIMIDVPEGGDHIMLKGKKRGTYVRLSRLDEGEDFQTNLADVNSFMSTMFSTAAPNMDVVTLGDSVMRMANASTGRANLYPYDGDQIIDEQNFPFLITKRGGKYYLRFKDELTAPDGTTAQEFVYNEAADQFVSLDNEAFTITGQEPKEFFQEALNDGHKWRINRASEKSDDINTKFEDMRKAFSARSRTLNYLIFSLSDGQLQVGVNYKPSSSAATTVYYNFTLAASNTGVALTYAGPANESAQNILNNYPSVEAMMNALTNDYTVTPGTTAFNLTTVTFTANNNNWFTLTYNK